MIIDFHTHAFPDALSARAVSQLETAAGIRAALDGRLCSLLASMDAANIEVSVVAPIATKVAQFEPILAWLAEIASNRIVPFASVHPKDPLAVDHVRAVAGRGIAGIKLHPYYQDCDLDAPEMWPIYAAMESLGLVLLCHAGFDIAFPRVRRCEPIRVRRVIEAFPRLRFVAAHLGGWHDWEQVEEHLLGQRVYLDTSSTIDHLGDERLRQIILHHPPELVLFGSDSPWNAQEEYVQRLRGLNLGPDREYLLFEQNARQLLELAPLP